MKILCYRTRSTSSEYTLVLAEIFGGIQHMKGALVVETEFGYFQRTEQRTLFYAGIAKDTQKRYYASEFISDYEALKRGEYKIL